MSNYKKPLISNPQGGGYWAVKVEPGVVLTGVEMQGTSQFGFASTMNRGLVRSYVEVGRYCSIGRDVTLGLGYYDTELPSTSPFFAWPATVSAMRWASEKPKRRVIIGHDVRIGDGARIESGVVIGTGAVITTGSVVQEEVPPYAVVSGVPGQIVAWRFSEPIRQALLESEWWMYEPSELQKYMCPDPLDFLARLNIASIPRFPFNFQEVYSDR